MMVMVVVVVAVVAVVAVRCMSGRGVGGRENEGERKEERMRGRKGAEDRWMDGSPAVRRCSLHESILDHTIVQALVPVLTGPVTSPCTGAGPCANPCS